MTIPTTAWLALTFVLWAMYATHRQVDLYGWSWRVPVCMVVNFVACPVCMIVATIRGEQRTRRVVRTRDAECSGLVGKVLANGQPLKPGEMAWWNPNKGSEWELKAYEPFDPGPYLTATSDPPGPIETLPLADAAVPMPPVKPPALIRSYKFGRKAEPLARTTASSAVEIYDVLRQLARLFPECRTLVQMQQQPGPSVI